MKFTYDEYKDMLSHLKRNGYSFADYRNFNRYNRAVILRHDVDTDLEKAVQLAEIESIGGVNSTYFILISSDFYNPFSKNSIECINNIIGLGHRIGLHFDEQKYFTSDEEWNEESMVEYIRIEKGILENMAGQRVDTVSMHRPSANTLKADLVIPEMINSYGKQFFNDIKYISDSYHRWREDFWNVVDRCPPKIQLLTHAFWYNDESITRSCAFKNFISHSAERAYNLLEMNALPPEVSLKESLAEEGATIDL